MSGRRFAVVAGGGTGGHVLQALAVARALVGRGHDPASIELVGSRRGQEGTLLADQGFPLVLLPGRGLLRSTRPEATLANLAALGGLVAAAGRTLVDLLSRRPAVVVTVGGYAALPTGSAALALRLPLVVCNVDAVPGLVNRLLGRFATRCAVAFPGTPLPRPRLTGAAVRHEIAAVDRSPAGRGAARAALGLLPESPAVCVFGGSLGARRLNRAALELAGRWRERRLSIFHVSGRAGYEETRAAALAQGLGDGGPDGGLCYRLVPFEERMELLYQAADVVVCRAGAITVAELAVAGVPAVLVPLPGAPGDHQTANAQELVATGAARLLRDESCRGEELGSLLEGLLADQGALDAMAQAAAALGRPDAAERIAELVEEVAGARRR